MKDIVCSICLDDVLLIDLHDNVGHCIHLDCLCKYAASKHFHNVSCPECRKILSLDDLIKLGVMLPHVSSSIVENDWDSSSFSLFSNKDDEDESFSVFWRVCLYLIVVGLLRKYVG